MLASLVYVVFIDGSPLSLTWALIVMCVFSAIFLWGWNRETKYRSLNQQKLDSMAQQIASFQLSDLGQALQQIRDLSQKVSYRERVLDETRTAKAQWGNQIASMIEKLASTKATHPDKTVGEVKRELIMLHSQVEPSETRRNSDRFIARAELEKQSESSAA